MAIVVNSVFGDEADEVIVMGKRYPWGHKKGRENGAFSLAPLTGELFGNLRQ
jgi:hypothetical protein